MRQVFRARPWVLPAEPAKLAELFRHGRVEQLERGATLSHGGLDGGVALLLEGLATFAFLDARGRYHTFALVLPGRTIGDLDALNPNRTNVIAECIRPSRVLIVANSDYRRALRTSTELMEMYADLSILKEETIIEGAFANFTMDLDRRLRVLFLALFLESGRELSLENWNDCPVSLSVTEIAQIVAGNRSWVSTRLSEWAREGLFRKTGRTMSTRAELFESVKDWIPAKRVVEPVSVEIP
ncbi:MAG: Crp/Fnr family transcriptional regulator [Duodenibacillus sp.]|nr:Crp/Fnr family transcriptional regulator [Duodenibacillus sp.]